MPSVLSDLLDEATPVAVLKPGDRVLLMVSRTLSMDVAEKIKDRLTARFPDVEFTVAGDCVGALVAHPELEPVSPADAEQEPPC